MAIKHECDRCLKQFCESDSVRALEYPGMPDYFTFGKHSFNISHKDLCFDCLKQLNEFLMPLRKVNEK